MIDRITTEATQNATPNVRALDDRYRAFAARPETAVNAEREVLGDVAVLPQITRWAARSLLRASDNLASGVSRGHMQRHFQRLASRAGQSIFKDPSDAPRLVQTALREAREAALRNGDDLAAGRTVRSGATEVTQQGERLAVTRRFDRAVGEAGENNLRVVVGKSGNIVTAYPVRSAASAGAFFGVVGLPEGRADAMYRQFDSRVVATANAVEAQTRRESRPGLFNELIGILDPTGIFYAEPGNAGEEAYLITQRGARDAVADIEISLGRSLSDEERQVFQRRFASAVTTAAALRE